MIKKLNVSHLGRFLGTITISAGVANIPDRHMSVAEALRRADSALYRAKREGRDRVIMDRRGGV
jgi:diguanylate cyclase (GGDEF)-like protein